MAGGNITAGMGVAAANEWMIGQLDAYFEAHPELSKDQKTAISLGASAVLGAALDGGQGAAIATNATQYNYLDHLQAEKLVGALKKCGKEDEACRLKAFSEIQADHKRNEEAMQQACLNPNSSECVRHVQAMLDGQTVLGANASLVGMQGALLNAGTGSNAMNVAQKLKNLDAWIDTNCKGISAASCSQKLQAAQSKEEWIKNVLLDFTPIVGDIKGFAEAETGSDYLWATIGLIPMAGDAAKAIAKANNVGDVGRTVDGLQEAGAGVRATDESVSIGGQTCVYSCVVDGVTRYVGITDDIVKRGQAHLREKGIVIDKIEGLQNLSRADARAVEQALIEFHGLGKDGGTLINKINSISKINNPTKYEQGLIRGAELLKNAGYGGF